MLSDPAEGAASLAEIELGVDEERCCPHCGDGGRRLRRFRSRLAGRTFAALTSTALYGIHHKKGAGLPLAPCLPKAGQSRRLLSAETFVLEGWKGERRLERELRQRALSREPGTDTGRRRP